ncbi:MAG: ribose-5-phosphate isomerase RpiA [Candidatus Bathyarchaeia archaeon]
MVSLLEEEKRKAAIEASKLVKDGQVVGLGTGSTAMYMVEELGRRVREENLHILGIPTSNVTANLASRVGISLTTLSEHPELDIAIDGADQVDPGLNLIKGMGGALTREKIVDGAAKTFVVIVDESKLTQRLGLGQVVPVEVIPFAVPVVARRLVGLGGKPKLRMDKASNNPFLTDNGNNILDVDFGIIFNPKQLEQDVKMITGVVETGLFVGLAHLVYVGYPDRVEMMKR